MTEAVSSNAAAATPTESTGAAPGASAAAEGQGPTLDSNGVLDHRSHIEATIAAVRARAEADGTTQEDDGEGSSEASPVAGGQAPVPGAQAQGEANGEPSRAQARADYIAAQRATRRAQSEQKRAKELAAKADHFTQATGNWRQDPAAMLASAGIPLSEFYNELTVKMLGEDQKPDPLRDRVNEAVAPFKQELEQERARRAAESINRQIANTINNIFVPVVQDADKYESLITWCGSVNNAAIYVYQVMEKHYKATGETLDPRDAADQLEAIHEKQFDDSARAVSGMKKFKGRYAAVEQQVAPTQAQGSGKTLTSRQAPTVQATERIEASDSRLSKDEYIQQVIARTRAKTVNGSAR